MIKLTRLGGEAFILNADLIRYVESRPDTFVTLTSGERLVVTESMDEVLRRAVAYQQAKHLLPPPARLAAAATPAPLVADSPVVAGAAGKTVIERSLPPGSTARRAVVFRGAARRAF